MSLPQTFPTTAAELYDDLQAKFGLGTYDDLASRLPWFKTRMTEIGILKRICTSRRVTPRQVGIAAWYCQQRHIPIYGYSQLIAQVPEAMREFNEQKRALDAAVEQNELNDAIADAMERGDTEWAEKLIRVAPANARSLLDDYSKTKTRSR